MFTSGTIALMTVALPCMCWPRICPRRKFRSLMTEPTQPSGVTTSTFMIGSSSTDLAFCSASRNATRAAISKVSAEESSVMIVAVDQLDLHVDHREARNHPRGQHDFETLLDATDVLL